MYAPAKCALSTLSVVYRDKQPHVMSLLAVFIHLWIGTFYLQSIPSSFQMYA